MDIKTVFESSNQQSYLCDYRDNKNYITSNCYIGRKVKMFKCIMNTKEITDMRSKQTHRTIFISICQKLRPTPSFGYKYMS